MDARITPLLDSSFELELYEAALRNAADASNRLRLSNFAFAMRELMRHVFDRLAPNINVTQCEWFKQEHQTQGRATGAQKAVYAVQGGLAPEYVAEVLNLDLRPVIDRHKKAVRELSEYTHVRPEVFNLAVSIVNEHIAETEDAVGALFEAIASLRKELIEALWERIDSAIVYEALRESIKKRGQVHLSDEGGLPLGLRPAARWVSASTCVRKRSLPRARCRKKGSGSFVANSWTTPRPQGHRALGQRLDLRTKTVAAQGTLLMSVSTQCLCVFR